jgi:hypothetical protein
VRDGTHYMMEYVHTMSNLGLNHIMNEGMLFVLSVTVFTLSFQLEILTYNYCYGEIWGFSLYFIPSYN